MKLAPGTAYPRLGKKWEWMSIILHIILVLCSISTTLQWNPHLVFISGSDPHGPPSAVLQGLLMGPICRSCRCIAFLAAVQIQAQGGGGGAEQPLVTFTSQTLKWCSLLENFGAFCELFQTWVWQEGGILTKQAEVYSIKLGYSIRKRG